jgi:hypothetical protein
LTREKPSNWFRNALNGEVTLEIRGKRLRARGVEVTDPVERQALLPLYRKERAAYFPRLFGLPADAPEADLLRVFATHRFIRFTKLK